LQMMCRSLLLVRHQAIARHGDQRQLSNLLGHYARKGHDPETNRPKLLRPLDRQKDQTYYLSSMKERGLSRALFPLEGLYKSDVREIAERAGLHTASREESMGICFVGERRRFADFLGQFPNAVLHVPVEWPLRFMSCCVYSGLPSRKARTHHRCENGARSRRA